MIHGMEIYKVKAAIINGSPKSLYGTLNKTLKLVGLTNELYRCMNCGADLQQHVNGKISYLPVMTSPNDGGKVFVKEWK